MMQDVNIVQMMGLIMIYDALFSNNLWSLFMIRAVLHYYTSIQACGVHEVINGYWLNFCRKLSLKLHT